MPALAVKKVSKMKPSKKNLQSHLLQIMKASRDIHGLCWMIPQNNQSSLVVAFSVRTNMNMHYAYNQLRKK